MKTFIELRKINVNEHIEKKGNLSYLSWAWAQTERPDLNIRQIAEQFKDYWIAQPGQKGVKLDWSATWRNWVRNSKATKANPADIIRLTVPASNEPDAALAKIKADEQITRPPTQAEREMLASLKRKS